MISSRIKNNIYALTSLSVILLTLVSFILITNFMVDMNDLVFNINDSASDVSSVPFNASGYENIKDVIEHKLAN